MKRKIALISSGVLFVALFVWFSPYYLLDLVALLNASPHRDASFSFATFGDVRPGPSSSLEWYGFPTLSRVLTASKDLDLFVGLGDYVHLDERDAADVIEHKYRTFAGFMKPMEDAMRVEYAPGNHEFIQNDVSRELYARYVREKPYYAFEMGGIHFLILSTTEKEYPGRIGLVREQSENNSPQARWLLKELQSITTAKPDAVIVIALHHPILDQKPGEGFPEHTQLADIFAAYGVDLVLQGYVHYYRRHVDSRGVVYVTQGQGGSPGVSVDFVPKDAFDVAVYGYPSQEETMLGYTRFDFTEGALYGKTFRKYPWMPFFMPADSFEVPLVPRSI